MKQKKKVSLWSRLLALLCVMSMLIMPAYAENAVSSYDLEGVGKVYYIAPNGSDTNPGSFAEPFATLEVAMNAMEPGDILYVRGGEYRSAGTGKGVSNKNGSPEKWFTVMNYPGEHPVFNGEWGRDGGDGFCIWLKNCSYWHFEGLEICEYQETGAYVDENSEHIEFVNTIFHDITDYVEPHCPYGRSGITAYSDYCLVEGCEFYNIGTNRSYGEMTDHGVYIVNTGKDWIFRNNYFHDIPAGGAIHIYGGGAADKTGTLIEENLIVRTYMGVVLGTEGCRETEVRNNTFWHNTGCDIFLTEGTRNNNIHHNVFGPLLPDQAGILSNHFRIPQLWCLYNTIDYNFYDDSAESSSVYPVLLENFVAAGNTFTQKVTWEAWTGAAEEGVVYEEKYDNSEVPISGFGMEQHGQTGAAKLTDPENGNFSLSESTECTIEDIGRTSATWSQKPKETADPILIVNDYGFENSEFGANWNLSQWGTPLAAELTSEVSWSGAQSLKVTQNSTSNGMIEPKQSFNGELAVTPGHEYQISLKVKNENLNGTVMLYCLYEGNDLDAIVIANEPAGDGQWKTLTGTFTPKAGNTKFRIQLLFNGSGTCYIDDFNISDKATVPTEAPSGGAEDGTVNLLGSNSGFESGTAGWYFGNSWGTPDPAPIYTIDTATYKSGAQSLHITHTIAGNTTTADVGTITLKPSTTYSFRGYIKTSGEVSSNAIAGCYAIAGGYADFVARTASGETLTDWTLVQGQFTTGDAPTTADIRLYFTGQGEVWFDDVEFFEGSVGTPDEDDPVEETNLIANPGFEDDLTGNWDYLRKWVEGSTAVIERTTAEKNSGDYSVHIQNTAANDKTSIGNNWRTNITGNREYTLTAKVKANTTDPNAKLYFVIDECDYNSQHTGFDRYRVVSTSVTGSTDGWQEHSATFTTAATAARICVCFFAEGQGDFYIDDVTLSETNQTVEIESMVPSPSFEAGFYGWNADNYSDSGVTPGEAHATFTEARTGHWSAYANHTVNAAANASEAQATCINTGFTLPVTSGKSYLIRAWVKTGSENAEDAYSALFIREAAGSVSGTSDFSGNKVVGVNDDWTMLVTEYTPAADTTTLYVGLYFRGYGQVWFDDVEVIECENVDSLLANPGFESQLTSWTPDNWSNDRTTPIEVSAVSDVSKNGVSSLHIKHTQAQDTSVVYQHTPLEAGATYRLRAYVKTGSGNDDAAYTAFYIREADSSNWVKQDFVGTRVTGVAEKWNLIEGEFVATATTTAAHICLYFNGAGEVWVDDIVLEKVDLTLRNKKTELKEALTEKLEEKDEYYKAEQDSLAELVEEGCIAIDAATSEEEAQAAYDAALAKINNLMTKEEHAAAVEALKQKKEAAKAAVDEMATPADYAEPIRSEVEKLLSSTKQLIDSATDEARIEELLELLQRKLDGLEKNSTTDNAKAAEVIAMIEAIDDVTLEDEDAIKAARDAYDALTDAQKELVTNYEDLLAAEKHYEDLLAAKAVDDLIDEIGCVTIGSKQKIEAARDAYEALTDEQKALVTKLDVLEAAEVEYRRQLLVLGAAITSGAVSDPVVEFPFADVPTTAWYYDEVKEAWENDLIDGMSADRFDPNGNLTVAQAIKLAAALHQMYFDGKVTLENGIGNWYDSYVDYAVANGIIEAKYDNYTNAQMNAAISREEFVHIFFGAMPERSYYACNTVANNAIPDVKSGDPFADEIYAFYRAGILTGSDAQGTFQPDSNIKRSEVAAILIRMFDTNARQAVILR